MTDYSLLCEQLDAFCAGTSHLLSVLSNASALLWQALDDINWAGFYLQEGNELVLGPFQGKPACMLIPAGKGVCGTAAAENRTVRVPDVHRFPGHIACDSDSNSEIVIPIHKNGRLFGVLDIDSPHCDRFTADDQTGLNKFVAVLEAFLEKTKN